MDGRTRRNNTKSLGGKSSASSKSMMVIGTLALLAILTVVHLQTPNGKIKEVPEDKLDLCGIKFLHIRKAGGTYIGNTLRTWLRNENRYNCCGVSQNGHRCGNAPSFYSSASYDNWTCPNFHFVENEYNSYNPDVLDVPCILSVTSIRDPIQRIISHFLYNINWKQFKLNNPNISSDEISYNLALGNESLWHSFMDEGSQCPKSFWKNYVPNYLSFALDPWYGDP